jgi:hypothetical protein
MNSVPKRVIIRAPDELFNENYDITKASFCLCGFSKDDETYLWIRGGHYVHVGVEGRGRSHVIIDMDKGHVQSLGLEGLPYEIWRATKNSGALVRTGPFNLRWTNGQYYRSGFSTDQISEPDVQIEQFNSIQFKSL